MDISKIIQILDKWNFWSQNIKTGFKREYYLDKLKKYLSIPEIITLTGVRRSGKSTIVLQVIEYLINTKKVPKHNTLYINFEEPFAGQELNLEFLIKTYEAYLEFFNPKGKIYLFLDEIQLIKNWEKFVASLYDRKENIKIFIAGSSAKLLNTEISTLLSGRYISETIYPLSFKEFLDFKKINYQPLIRDTKIFNYLREYLKFGGFPRVIMEKDEHIKNVVLLEYFNSILERDIILRNKIKNIPSIKEVINYSLSNISTQVSTYHFEKYFSIASQNTKRYFEYLEDAFLLQFVPFFSYSVKKQIYNSKKVMAIDVGLVNVVSFMFKDDFAKLLENIVFLKLIHQKHKPYYWRNGTEIDFILRTGHKVSRLINVCYNLENKNTMQREISSLEKGLAEFPGAKGEIIYWQGEETKHSKIKFINILDFLLN